MKGNIRTNVTADELVKRPVLIETSRMLASLYTVPGEYSQGVLKWLSVSEEMITDCTGSSGRLDCTYTRSHGLPGW